MKTLFISGIVAFFLSFILGIVTIPILKKIKFGQPILKYVQTHKDKSGTPTMGGLFFVISAITTFFAFGGSKTVYSVVALSIGVAFMLVGFLDDYIKIRYRKNEGLRAYQKMLFLTGIAVISGIFVYRNGLTWVYAPFVNVKLELGAFIIPLTALIFMATTNSVNLTDGLDGLAGGTSVSYLICIAVLIYFQAKSNKSVAYSESDGLILLSVCLIGAILAFLVFNVNKAQVFMGDTGSLSLGGFIGAISIFSGNSLYIPLVGITFVASSVSVIIQVIHFKRTKKRVFLMSPIHHHFQLKGYSECKISFCYSIITVIMGLVSIISYM